MMKKIVYIVSLVLCVSCNQFSQKSENATAPREDLKVHESTLDVEADDKLKEGFLDFKTIDFSIGNFRSEIATKLQANYESQVLAAKHPEFAVAIQEQLAASSKFHTSLSDSIQKIEITDIELVGTMKTLNDSTFTQKIHYTKHINSNYTEKDSVLVVLQQALIKIDHTVRINTSFSFQTIE
ncbi:hypothetical protein C8N46_10549 [Kordia periserrulae]|uniref:Uncharacterized protein n=1 Tax=Kordia periserrulae TaxID=701523 RepID=A0A2T6BXV2_9FLAO|nr:hypothetical protein [Kordia periserrulae]PTX60893.1 hypothetical protein C8N46_10549 [Kordia periserrulae]